MQCNAMQSCSSSGAYRYSNIEKLTLVVIRCSEECIATCCEAQVKNCLRVSKQRCYARASACIPEHNSAIRASGSEQSGRGWVPRNGCDSSSATFRRVLRSMLCAAMRLRACGAQRACVHIVQPCVPVMRCNSCNRLRGAEADTLDRHASTLER